MKVDGKTYIKRNGTWVLRPEWLKRWRKAVSRLTQSGVLKPPISSLSVIKALDTP